MTMPIAWQSVENDRHFECAGCYSLQVLCQLFYIKQLR